MMEKEAAYIQYMKNLRQIQDLLNQNVILVSRIKDYVPPENTDDELIPTSEICKLLGVSDQKVRDLISHGIIHGYGGGKSFMAKRGDVIEYREQNMAITPSTRFMNAMAR